MPYYNIGHTQHPTLQLYLLHKKRLFQIRGLVTMYNPHNNRSIIRLLSLQLSLAANAVSAVYKMYNDKTVATRNTANINDSAAISTAALKSGYLVISEGYNMSFLFGM